MALRTVEDDDAIARYNLAIFRLSPTKLQIIESMIIRFILLTTIVIVIDEAVEPWRIKPRSLALSLHYMKYYN